MNRTRFGIKWLYSYAAGAGALFLFFLLFLGPLAVRVTDAPSACVAEDVAEWIVSNIGSDFGHGYGLPELKQGRSMEEDAEVVVFETSEAIYEIIYEPHEGGYHRRIQAGVFFADGSPPELLADRGLDCEADYGYLDLETFGAPEDDAHAMRMFFSHGAWVTEPEFTLGTVGEEHLPYWNERLDRFYEDAERLLIN